MIHLAWKYGGPVVKNTTGPESVREPYDRQGSQAPQITFCHHRRPAG
jgi:hypothetical protein